MDLVRRDRRSLKDSESSVGEYGFVTLARRPVLAHHIAVIGSGSAPGKPITLVIRTHPVKAIAARQLSFEVIDAREFDVRHRRLVVTAILVKPWDGIRARAAVRWFVVLRNLRRAALRRRLCVQRGWQRYCGDRNESKPKPTPSA